jgi:phosphoglycolate phosphatase
MACFFFDLDGTLTDSRQGLFAAFRAGLANVGAAPLPDDALQPYLGTPLPLMFAAVSPGLAPDLVEAGIAAFRTSYQAEGIFRNTLYPGVRRMLECLIGNGHRAWVVTSKPEPHASLVIRLLGIEPYFRGIVGAGLAETDTKTQLVARALALSGAHPDETIMLGDRSYDVIGALENHVAPVGALWGYGTAVELRRAGCKQFASSAADFMANFIAADAFAGAAD